MADTEKKTAKYRFLVDTIKEKIKNGEYEPGERMKSENTLSEQFGYSRPNCAARRFPSSSRRGSLNADAAAARISAPRADARRAATASPCDDVYFRLYFSDDHPRH